MNLYAILGVAHSASADEIRRAYRQAALLWHPDRNPDPDAADCFQTVQHAYERLRDPERRRSYDLALETAVGPRKLRFADGERPDWVPPDDEREPLRFVAGRGWTSLDEPPTGGADGALGQPGAVATTTRRGWTRDERLGLGVAVFAAVVGAVAIAIAPMFS